MLKHCQSLRLRKDIKDSPCTCLTPHTLLRVYRGVDGEDGYRVVSLYTASTAKEIVEASMKRFRLEGEDPSNYSLILQLSDPNPRQEGLTLKTLVLENNVQVGVKG